jgi:crossover junction endodeoxyribonuclease RuvC
VIQIAGIDIGTYSCGWAVIDEEGQHLASGTWKLPEKASLNVRLGLLHTKTLWFWSRFRPVVLGIEEPWVGPNRQTALVLAKAWGVIFAGSCLRANAIVGVTPTQGKKALTNYAKADKEQMRAALKMQFNVEDKTTDADRADAVGIALFTRVKYLEARL